MSESAPSHNDASTEPVTSVLRLLHVSDIHFAGYWDRTPRADYEHAIRRKMLADFALMHETLGDMDGILLVGDVANWGKSSEYDKAVSFLDGAAELIGCQPERVVCVPGNHDIDRDEQDEVHSLLRHQMRTIEPRQINDHLLKNLQSPKMSEVLMAPFVAYNEFAFRYGCHFDTVDKMFPPKQFAFGPLTVQVMGVNSSWICDGSEEADHETNSLVAGTFQAVDIPEDSSTISIALCHHPANWLRDGKELTSWLDTAHLVLTGHEHVAGIDHGTAGVPLRVASGAVNPSREEDGWLPAYNVIELEHTWGSEHFVVTVHPRSWVTNGPAGFDYHDGLGGGPKNYQVPLQHTRQRRVPPGPPEPPNTTGPNVQGPHSTSLTPPEPIESARHSQVHTIMRAATEVRRAEAKVLGLIEDSDDLGHRLLDRRIIQRANERQLTATLAARIIERKLSE